MTNEEAQRRFDEAKARAIIKWTCGLNTVDDWEDDAAHWWSELGANRCSMCKLFQNYTSDCGACGACPLWTADSNGCAPEWDRIADASDDLEARLISTAEFTILFKEQATLLLGRIKNCQLDITKKDMLNDNDNRV